MPYEYYNADNPCSSNEHNFIPARHFARVLCHLLGNSLLDLFPRDQRSRRGRSQIRAAGSIARVVVLVSHLYAACRALARFYLDALSVCLVAFATKQRALCNATANISVVHDRKIIATLPYSSLPRKYHRHLLIDLFDKTHQLEWVVATLMIHLNPRTTRG